MPELRDAAIAGVYVSEQGDLAARSQPDLYWECVKGALADAGLTLADVDGLIGPAPEGFGVRHALPGSAVADIVGHPLRFHAQTGVGAASQAAGVGLAALAVANGLAEVVIVPTAAAGASVGYTAADRNAAVEHMAKLGSPFEAVMGTTRVADFAFVARRHMHEYGTTSEQLAAIAVAQRHSATLHPRSVMGPKGEITVEQVLTSRMMAEPLHLLDCCIVNQGGGCVVVTRRDDVVAAGRHAPVVLLGWGEGHGYLDPNAAPSLTSFSGRVAADDAFHRAGVSRDDVDVAGISDHFTISVVVELEDSGFCAKGEGGAFVDDGALALGGRLPTNTHGGYLSGTHAASCALFTLIELVEQLRGGAGDRQVAGAELAYACSVGGVSQAHYAAVLGEGVMAYAGFRPDVSPLHAPFWDALRRHELVVQQCASCGRLRFVPTELCPHCSSADATWSPVSGRGRVYTYTVVHRAPTPAYQADAPYALAYVELEEGVRMPTRLVDVDVDGVEVDMPVEVVFDDVDDDLTLYRFRPTRSEPER